MTPQARPAENRIIRKRLRPTDSNAGQVSQGNVGSSATSTAAGASTSTSSHITDSEANSYIRARRLVAEPGRTLMDYDENQWSIALDYHDQSIEDALNLFRWLRSKTHTLIKSLPESAWSNTAYHPENGDMTLDDWLDVYESHVREHIEFMQQNYEAWQAQR